MSNRISPQGYQYEEDPRSTNPFWEEDYYNDLDATVTVDDTTGDPEASVTKRQLADGTTVFDFEFSGLKGESGEGRVPELTASASVDSTVGTPSVTVTKTGTDEHPNLDFAFHNLKGDAGSRGPAGPQGEDGNDGVTPEITMTATTDSTSSANPTVTVTKSGTTEAPSFNLALSGFKGADGEQGPAGTQGPAGADGVTPSITMTASTDSASSALPVVTVTKTGTDANPNFALAFSGLKGATGAQGPQGPQGPQGEQGIPGEAQAPNITMTATTDNTTSANPTVTVTKTGTDMSPTYAFAFEGLKGATGSQGPAGADGSDGVTPAIAMTATADALSSANPTVTVTKSGTDANPSFALAFSGLKGETGATGATGAQGPEGPQGEQGEQGPQGIQGIQGPAGADGSDGVTPSISATASADSTHSANPSVTVTKTGTDASPSFDFAFSGLMGETGGQGPAGATGATPSITMTATSDATHSANPTVTVTKSGTDLNPVFALAFSGLMGASGSGGGGNLERVNLSSLTTAQALSRIKLGTILYEGSPGVSGYFGSFTLSSKPYWYKSNIGSTGSATSGSENFSVKLENCFGIITEKAYSTVRGYGFGNLVAEGLTTENSIRASVMFGFDLTLSKSSPSGHIYLTPNTHYLDYNGSAAIVGQKVSSSNLQTYAVGIGDSILTVDSWSKFFQYALLEPES